MTTKRECSVDGCASPVTARGWCNKHYLRWSKHGTPTPAGVPELSRPQTLPNGDRVCTGCSIAQPIEQYDRDNRAASGRRSQCKTCRAEKVAKWYQSTKPVRDKKRAVRVERDRAKIRANDNARYQRSRRKRIELATKHAHIRRARVAASNPEQGITVEALRKRDGDTCCYCSETMDFMPGKRGEKANPRRASIEHIRPLSKGGAHSWDNVALACIVCNIRRGNRGEWS